MSIAHAHAHAHVYDGPSPSTSADYANWDGLEAFALAHSCEKHVRRDLEGIEALSWHDEPTKTQTYRDKYARNLRGALKRIRVASVEAIEEDDLFGLETEALAAKPSGFDFESDTAKEGAFREWLDTQLEDDVLREYGGENRYIHSSYERAVKDADTHLRDAGVADPDESIESVMGAGVHEDQLEALYTRNLRALEGMTDAIESDVTRELTDGFAAGENPRAIGRRFRDVIGTVDDGTARGAMARAETIARTEVMNAHAYGTTRRYEQFGVEEVTIVLAADACSLCVDAQAGAPYSPSEARSLVPIHPNCVCAVAIYTGN